nr:ATP-binding protein [Mycolicibacterium gilvum]
MASAMIDRIVHRADVIVLKGASYRIKHTAIDTLLSVEADREADSSTAIGVYDSALGT